MVTHAYNPSSQTLAGGLPRDPVWQRIGSEALAQKNKSIRRSTSKDARLPAHAFTGHTRIYKVVTVCGFWFPSEGLPYSPLRGFHWSLSSPPFLLQGVAEVNRKDLISL